MWIHKNELNMVFNQKAEIHGKKKVNPEQMPVTTSY